ncbi:hypothetical protein NC653_029491 [Populus alba x Populus x berolinensis]|uniref:Uncharacterized protein n=1 Tax=Populus alba x Populus x berolinensis TaxID=444605 RepID=A0AAD6M2J7_9ROSI|nr:hypothetical protein NC653_029491 [Populus alba x Populus x berolinensis]
MLQLNCLFNKQLDFIFVASSSSNHNSCSQFSFTYATACISVI